MIKVQGLVKNYGQHKVLKNITFDAQKGELITLLGPNGAGKTTLMRVLSGNLSPDAGNVEIFGKTYDKQRLDILKHIGYMPENTPLYKEFTVFEYLYFVGQMFYLKRKKLQRAIAQAAYDLKLIPVLKQKISTLSKGYLQRTGIAAAVMHNPQLLILDEPTEGLDPNQKTILRRYLRKYAQNALVLISTHLLEEAEVLNSRMLILVDGKICQDTTVDQLRTFSRDGTLADAFYRLTMENINQEADNNVVSSL